jgi:hypothetical protein
MRPINFVHGLAHALEAVTSQCGEFNKQWNAPEPQRTSIPQLWQGEWQSETNHHHGLLRCVLTMTSSDSLLAFFRANYSRFLRACYKVELRTVVNGEDLLLSGSTDLGPLAGGEYKYSGTITHGEFTCHYHCRYDHGTFHLKPFHSLKPIP